MTRLRLWTAVVALLLSCTPTEPCACPPALTRALVYGWVRTSAGAPSPSAFVRVDVAPDTGCAALRTSPERTEWEQSSADAAGAFRLEARSVYGPRLHCVRVTAFRGRPGTSDSARVEGLILNFRGTRERPDSIGVVLTLP